MLENENQGFSQEQSGEETFAQQELQQEQSTNGQPNDDKKKKQSKNAKYRATASVLTVLVIAALIVVNVLVGALGSKINTKIDMTHDRVLDFSEQTIETVKNLQQDINVYSLIPENNDSVLTAVDTMLGRYQNLSGHIKYQKIDSTTNPAFVQKYQGLGEQISQYSIIFESGEKFKVVDINDAVTVNSQTRTVQSLSAEQKFTSAIQFVVSEKNTTAAVVEGHGEVPASSFTTVLADENYAVESINLASADIGDTIDMLILASPQTDYTAEEIDKLDAFFDRGGQVQLFMDVSDASLPRLEAYLAEWGVSFQPGFVVDTNSGSYMQSPLYLLPNIQKTDYTQTLVSNKLMMLVPQARGIAVSNVTGIDSQTLLTTSNQSFVRTDPNIQTVEMADSDIKGPVTLAAMLAKYTDSGAVARLFVAGNTYFLNEGYLTQSAFANKDFYLNVSSYMTDKPNDVYIRPKDVSPAMLAISLQKALLFGGLAVIIAIGVLIAGIVVWIRRRRL